MTNNADSLLTGSIMPQGEGVAGHPLRRRGTPAAVASTSAERRGADRMRTVSCVAKVSRGGAVGLWRVRNISDNGMMLLTDVEVDVGQKLSIALSDTIVMDATVVWCSGGRCGVEFEQPIDTGAVLKTLAAERQAPRYRAPRVPVSVPAVAYSEDGIHSVRVNDVSHKGIGFSHDGSFQPGMRIMVLMENGVERRGVVRWSDAANAGLMLTEPLSSAELEDTTGGHAQV